LRTALAHQERESDGAGQSINDNYQHSALPDHYKVLTPCLWSEISSVPPSHGKQKRRKKIAV